MPVDLTAKVGAELSAILVSIGEAARDYGARSFLVGGAVRDMLLGLPALDIDVMVEGDAGAFAAYLKREWSGYLPKYDPPEKLVIYSRYRTAKLPLDNPPLPGMDCLDFSSARSEDYPAPAQAPIIKPGDLYADLARRDFSVNALAIDLTPQSLGVLRDFFSGEEHLRLGLLHILHAASFEDDPARMLRGLRFIARLGFRFSEETELAFRAALKAGNLKLLPPARLFDELRKALSEECLVKVAEVFSRFAVFDQIGGLMLTPEAEDDLALVEEGFNVEPGAERWQLAFSALTSHLNDAEFLALLHHYAVHRKAQAVLVASRERLLSRAF